jgi:selenoprotein W-related protein
LAEQVLARFEDQITELVLIPSEGGRFEVMRDDLLVFSKQQLRRHAEIDEVLAAINSGQPVTQ